MSDWQPIDSAPKDGTEILGHNDGVYAIVSWQTHRTMTGIYGNWADRAGYLESYERPTHWQPLPEPPK
jgi:hypothetical protein